MRFRFEGKIRFYLKRLKNFWNEYKRNKMGMIGIAIVAFFIFLALFAPLLTPYDQYGGSRLAYKFAMPQWVTILPQYKDLPPTIEVPLNWTLIKESEYVDVRVGDELVINYTGGEEEASVLLGLNFTYSYSPPPAFETSFKWSVKIEPEGKVGYFAELTLLRGDDGEVYSIWDSNAKPASSMWERNANYAYKSIPSTTYTQYAVVQIDSTDAWLVKQRFGLEYSSEALAKTIFSHKTEYSLMMHIYFKPKSANATCTIKFLEFKQFRVLGRVHGVLGVDHEGRDIWSQLVYGSRPSLVIGIVTAIISSFIGLLVGVISGYFGGIIDETLMRVVDALICLPMLPLLMALVKLYGPSIWLIITLVACFIWVSPARVVRSQVLSIKEQPYIEAAKALGAGSFYIIIEHIVPNVLPSLFASMVLAIPDAILWEAALSFLGLGDPKLMTWGRMLNNAYKLFGFRNFVWWWILPPGLAIAFLSIGFVFIGHGLDEILNPRLRRR